MRPRSACLWCSAVALSAQFLVTLHVAAAVVAEFTPPGLFNALHGLARMEFSWVEDVPGESLCDFPYVL